MIPLAVEGEPFPIAEMAGVILIIGVAMTLVWLFYLFR
jgi:hypothetical protein